MSKKLIGIFIFSLLIFSTYAQMPADEVYLTSRLNGLKNLNEIMRIVDSFYKKNPSLRVMHNRSETDRDEQEEEFENDKMLFWNRWAYYQGSRLDERGDLTNITSRNLDAFMEEQQRDAQLNISRQPSVNGLSESQDASLARNITTGSWLELGPSSFGTMWGSLEGNGRVDRVAFHPTNSNIIYAGSTEGGLWKTIDGGSTWVNLSSYMSNLGVSGIVVDRDNPSTLYVLTGDGDSYFGATFVFQFGYNRPCGGVLKSTDGGLTWHRTGTFGSGKFGGYRLEQSPLNSNILLCATSLGLFRTTNGGSTWQQVISGNSITDVKFNPLNGNTVFAAGPGYYRYSQNGGASWNTALFSNSIASANRIAIGISGADTTKVYIICGPGTGTGCDGNGNAQSGSAGTFLGLFLSSNGGKNFNRVNNAPNILGIDNNGNDCQDQSVYTLGLTVDPSNASRLAICAFTIWSTSNGGTNFNQVARYWGGPNENVHPDVHCVEYNPLDGKLYAGTDGGVYVSNNDGTNWTFISNGLNCTQAYHFTGANDDRTHLAVGLQDNGTRNRTTYTSAFNHISSGDGFCVAYDPNNSSRFYQIINTGGRRISDDGATKAATAMNFIQFYPFVGRHPTNTNNLIVGRSDSLFISSNEASTFSKVNVGGNRRIVYAPSNPNIIYTASWIRGTTGGGVWKSTDGGSTWTLLNSKPGFPSGSSYVITSLAVHPSISSIVMVTFGGYNVAEKVIYSSDGGEHWRNFSAGLPNLPVHSVVIGSDNSAYIGTDDAIFFQSSSDTSWLPFYNGLPRVPVTDLVIFPTSGYIYASTFGRGLWYSPIKQSCDETLNLGSGAIGGQLFFQANNLFTSQTITGIDSTMVFYRGANSVVMQPGFEVPAGSHMKAYIGTCDDHTLPTYRNGQLNNRMIESPNYPEEPGQLKKDGSLIAYLEYTPKEKASNKLRVIIKDAGDYMIRFSDKKGTPIKEFLLTGMKTGTYSFTLQLPELKDGLYYLELRRDQKLCHFLEWAK